MQMQLSRERSFSSPTISSLTQDNKFSSHLSEHSSSTAGLNKGDVSESRKDKTAKKTLLDTSPDYIQSKKASPNPKEKTEYAISETHGAKSRKGLRRCSTFPRSKVIHAEEVTVPKTVLHGKEPVSEHPSYQRSVSVPHSFRLKSALKGSRVQDGVSPRSGDMHVRWAPDVYDPPITSSSHTVRKGGSTSSSSKGKKKGKKKDNNRRKNKGKKSSSSGGVGVSERESAIESRNASIESSKSAIESRNASIESSKSAIESRNASIESSKSAIETSDDITLICEADADQLELSSQDMKCGSEFLRQALSKMHFSTAEAS